MHPNQQESSELMSFHGEWDGKERLPHCFFQVADRVYHQDPLWIPESRQSISDQFYHHNGYFNGQNAVWVGVECGKTRLAGFYNLDAPLIDGLKVAYFGYWESVNDIYTNQCLFKEMEAWAKSLGAQKVYGPINFSTFGAYRIRLNHFDKGYFPGEPYNPPYYSFLLETMGYYNNKRFYSWFGELEKRVETLSTMMEGALSGLLAKGVRFEKLTSDYWLKNLRDIYQQVNDIFRDNFAYTGISYDAFERDYGVTFAKKICSETSVLALDSHHRMIGFFCFFSQLL
jgi:hypothetical protein